MRLVCEATARKTDKEMRYLRPERSLCSWTLNHVMLALTRGINKRHDCYAGAFRGKWNIAGSKFLNMPDMKQETSDRVPIGTQTNFVKRNFTSTDEGWKGPEQTVNKPVIDATSC